MNDIEILEWVCINKLYIDTHNECDYHNIHTAIENLIQRNKDLEQILELMSKSLDNISYDQIPIAIEELKFKLQDLEQIEKEHKEENGRLREELEKIEYIKRNFDYCLEQKIKEGIELKVKEKMQELDKEEKEAQESISDEEREEYSDASIGYLLMNIETRRNVLQELLEESEK